MQKMVVNKAWEEDWLKIANQLERTYAYFIITDAQVETYPYKPFERYIASSNSIITSWDKLPNSNTWLFGYIGYDLKNRFEEIESTNSKLLELPELAVFEPEVLVQFTNQGLKWLIGEPLEIEYYVPQQNNTEFGEITQLTSDEDYLASVQKIKNLIEEGEVYELNYCIDFQCEVKNSFSPFQFWQHLSKANPMPFAAFFKIGSQYISCHSPERFLKRQANLLIAQPIKGTAPRDLNNSENDEALAKDLQNSEKERAENVMIVDLMRNDMARIGTLGTIEVEELFGIYSFNTVHQMISTVTCQIGKELSLKQIIPSIFPMGSMTGAPKISAMKAIDNLENFSREAFSGCLGYAKSIGDFDFNVIIRSLFYDEKKGQLFWFAGSAITWDSVPEEELAEVKLKQQAIIKGLQDFSAKKN